MAIDGRRHRHLVALVCLVALSFTAYYSKQPTAFRPVSWSGASLLAAKIVPLDSYEDGADYYAYDELRQPDTDSSASNGNAVEQANVSFRQIDSAGARFNYTSSDVLVFLHIQKTGGTTFERYLVKQLQLPAPCRCLKKRKKCRCKRPPGSVGSLRSPWLFSRFSTGWSCGLHSDWTELVVSGCVDKYFDKQDKGHVPRRYFITTFLREPIARFMSEFRHVQRGATWQASKHLCNGRPPTAQELPPCFDVGQSWSGVTLQQFLACPSNLAFNRQTRMLADLTKVNCYNESSMNVERRQLLLLQSAKENLSKLAFFGLQDEMRKSQYLFEQTFNLTFGKPMIDMQPFTSTAHLTDDQRYRIEQVNQLDMALYRYGKHLFYERFEKAKRVDPMFDVNIAT